MIGFPKKSDQNNEETDRFTLPLLPLRDIVVFPHMVAPLFVGRDKSVKALTSAMNRDKQIFLATQTDAGIDNPKEKDISRMGTVGKVLQLLKLPDGTVKALVEGVKRARIVRFLPHLEYFNVDLASIRELPLDQAENEALIRAIKKSFEDYSDLNKNIAKDLVRSVVAINDPSQLADTIAAHFTFKIADKQKLLDTEDLAERLSVLLELIKLEIDIFKMDQRIKSRVKKQMEKTQKSYYLNEQMRAIKKEMGAEDDASDDLKELENQIEAKKMSEEATEKTKHEFKKLTMMAPMSAEATVVRGYIDWLISLPWFDKSEIYSDLDKAEKILNEDHYSLEKPKVRIVEYLAVEQLVKKVRGPILCFVGPPGVGKTSLARSVARATGRKYIRLSLGGGRDEAELHVVIRVRIGKLRRLNLVPYLEVRQDVVGVSLEIR